MLLRLEKTLFRKQSDTWRCSSLRDARVPLLPRSRTAASAPLQGSPTFASDCNTGKQNRLAPAVDFAHCIPTPCWPQQNQQNITKRPHASTQTSRTISTRGGILLHTNLPLTMFLGFVSHRPFPSLSPQPWYSTVPFPAPTKPLNDSRPLQMPLLPTFPASCGSFEPSLRVSRVLHTPLIRTSTHHASIKNKENKLVG